MHLNFNTLNKNFYIGLNGLNAHYHMRSINQFMFICLVMVSIPYLNVQTFRWLDRLPVWEQRITQKRQKKAAFDFMLRNLAEKERDIIEEFSDY